MRLVLDSGPDGGACPPVGDCRGFNGTCGMLATQFATVPVLPDYPNGLQDYTCTAFPDDASSVDSFIVGLIALAVAIPVTVFVSVCFEIANDNEAPESWLEWTGWRKFVFGPNAHRRWHYTRGAPPVRYIKWYVRSKDAPMTETFANLCRSFHAWATGGEPLWVEEAREAAAEEAAAEKQRAAAAGHAAPACEEEEASSASEAGSVSSSVCSAMALSAYKRQVMVVGLFGTVVCWTLFTWCAARLPAARTPPCTHSHLNPRAPPGSSSLVRAPAAYGTALPRLSAPPRARRRHAHLPPAWGRRATVLCALLGHQLRHRPGAGGMMRMPRFAAPGTQLTRARARSGRIWRRRRARRYCSSSSWSASI